MIYTLIAAVSGTAGGVAVSVLNDLLSRACLKRNPALLLSLWGVRQLLNVLYLAALYLLSSVFSLEPIPLLAGGALGVTVPSIFFTRRLVKMNDATGKSPEASEKTYVQKEKSDSKNG